jgi:hypothetical protein
VDTVPASAMVVNLDLYPSATPTLATRPTAKKMYPKVRKDTHMKAIIARPATCSVCANFSGSAVIVPAVVIEDRASRIWWSAISMSRPPMMASNLTMNANRPSVCMSAGSPMPYAVNANAQKPRHREHAS